MQNTEYRKEYCIVYDERGTCHDCQDHHHCTIRAAIAEQEAVVRSWLWSVAIALDIALLVGAFYVGRWIS